MAQHNSSASAIGTARSTSADSKSRSTLTPNSALQLFLKDRGRSVRASSSSQTKPLTQLQLALALNSSLSSLPKAKALLLQRYLGKRGKLYKRFLLRRQLWRSTRRPSVKMDFINNLRMIQSEEPSSDEDSCLTLSSFNTGRSSVSGSTTSTQDKSDEETKPVLKKKRDLIPKSTSPAQATAGASSIPEEPKKTDEVAKVQAQKPSLSINKTTTPAPETAESTGVKNSQKRKLDDEKSDIATNGQQRAAKKIKPEPAKTAEKVPLKPESSKAPSAPPTPQKPLPSKEFFQQRVEDMLKNPLGFDDFVYGTKRPMPRHLQRQFAQCRRRQREPTPPLVMSGGLGRVPNAKPAMSKGLKSQNLARDAQKRAHQQKVREHVQGLKGKNAGNGQGGYQRQNGFKKYTKSAYLNSQP